MVLIPIFPVYIRYVFYFCFLFVVFTLFGCFWLVGQVVCDWVSILVSRVFSGGFAYVLGVFRVSVAPLHFLRVVDSSLG